MRDRRSPLAPEAEQVADPARPTRRAFVCGSLCVLGAGSLNASIAAAVANAMGRTAGHGAVVSFALDRPYLDASGRAEPYHAPRGARAGDGLDVHGDANFIGQFGYV